MELTQANLIYKLIFLMENKRNLQLVSTRRKKIVPIMPSINVRLQTN